MANEARKSTSICAETVPPARSAATEFKAWRKRQGLWTPELSHKADLVQFDLDAVAKMERSIPAFNELVQKNLAEFQSMLER